LIAEDPRVRGDQGPAAQEQDIAGNDLIRWHPLYDAITNNAGIRRAGSLQASQRGFSVGFGEEPDETIDEQHSTNRDRLEEDACAEREHSRARQHRDWEARKLSGKNT
jgi:hypothetical protein